MGAEIHVNCRRSFWTCPAHTVLLLLQILGSSVYFYGQGFEKNTATNTTTNNEPLQATLYPHSRIIQLYRTLYRIMVCTVPERPTAKNP